MWKLSSVAARPYFLNGEFHYKLRQVLVQSWNELHELCFKRRSDEVKKQREQALKERKEPKLLPEGALPEKDFTFCLREVLKGKEEPPQVQDGVVYGMGQAPDGAKTTLAKDVVEKLVQEAAKIGKVAFGTTGEKPADKFVDYNQFCKNYSQGDFNAERYCQRKWENIYGRLLQHSKENPEDFGDNLAPRDVVKEALESPEMGLSTRMVEMLLVKYKEDDDEEDETEQLIKYPELCWRFAKKNIQDIMHEKCLAIFRKARVLDKARSKQVPKAEMEKVLRSPEIGLSEYEADLFIRRYLDHKNSSWEDEDQTINYDDVLFGRWEEIPCNPKLYSAFVGLEKNWERIADRFMASDVTTENGTIHIDDFKKLVLELNLDELKDKNAVEQVGNALDPHWDGCMSG